MTDRVAYFNGEFSPDSALAISIDDLGFVQGACVSERLRTFGGRLFRLDEHLQRLANSLQILNLKPAESLTQIGQIAEQLVTHNRHGLPAEDDLGLSLFVTPGIPASNQVTIGLHTYPLPFGQWCQYYTQGQALTETGIRQIPPSCWPPALKCRSRMHYYLADQRAQQIDAGSRAVLLDQDGFVSEASTANLVMYCEAEGLISPPLEKILPGVSLSVLAELAGRQEIDMHYRDFTLEELAGADEILLCSTSPCVWPVTRLNGRPTRGHSARPLSKRLLVAWSELVGLNIAEQACRFATRC